MTTRFTPRPASAGRYHDRALRTRVSAIAAAAWLAVPLPASPEIVEWTGNAPVYLVQWDEGFGLQTLEFQHFEQWHAACDLQQSTPHGAVCNQINFWDSNANWDRVGYPAQPTALDDARIPAGATAWISGFQSVYQGTIGNVAIANSLSALGTVYVAGYLNLGNGGFVQNLFLTPASTLTVNAGTLSVGHLDLSQARLHGAGTTMASSFGASVDAIIENGHQLRFGGVHSGSTLLHIGDRSAFYNDAGALLDSSTSVPGLVDLQGSSTWFTAPLFANAGEIRGPFTITNARFDNSGVVRIDHGQFLASGIGTHSGSFIGGADSTLFFDSKAGIGHHFLPESSIESDGQVVFNGTANVVEGYYRAADTVIGFTTAQVTFKGTLGFLDRLTVNPTSWVSFDHTAGVSFGELAINGPQAFAYLTTTTPSTAHRLTIADGGLNTANSLTVTDRFDWGSGGLYGPVTVNGTTTLVAGKRRLAGTLHNAGMLKWNAGDFTSWSGKVENAIGSTFEIAGDFSVADGTGGSFDNAGLVLKSAGNGNTILPLPLDNRGTVDVRAGTLGLYFGGRHTGRFSAAPGARIVLAGDNVIAGSVTTSGQVDVTSGSFSIADGGSYIHAAGNSMSVARLDVAPLGRFDNNGWFGISDWNNPAKVSNLGQLNNRGSLAAFSLANSGQIVNAAGADMTIHFDAGVNLGSINNAGSFSAANLDNRGTIVNSNAMTLSGKVIVSSAGSIGNSGTLNLWVDTTVAGRIDNSGTISAQGNLVIDSTGRIAGTGLYNDGPGAITRVNGLLEAQGGIFINGVLGGSGTVVGNVTLGQFATWKPGNSPGTMTVQGDVDIPLMAPAGMGWPGYETAPGNIEIEIASSSVYDRLQISGNASLDALVDFVLLPGYTPSDGDAFQWLNAASVFGFAVPRVFGLPTGWHGDLIADPLTGAMRFVLSNEPAVDWSSQIPAMGSVSVPAGTVASNWDWAGTPSLDRLDNAGWFINQPGASLWIVDLANQAGGVIANHGALTVSNAVDNAGELRNKLGAEMTVYGAFTNSGHLINSGTLTVGENNFGNLTNAAGARVDNHGLINRGYFTQIVNHGQFIVDGTVSNDFGWYYYIGTIQNDAGSFVVLPGGLVSGSGSYYQVQNSWDGESVTQVDGVLAAADIRFYSGRLTGSGRLIGPVSLGNVVVQPGNSPGTLTIEGSLASAQNTVFEIELAGPTLSDRLHVTGRATFSGGWLDFHLIDGYAPRIGDGFSWLQADGGIVGLSGLSWRVLVAQTDGVNTWWVDWQQPAAMRVSFHDGRIEFAAAAVPEPETWALMLAGVATVLSLARRRWREPRV